MKDHFPSSFINQMLDRLEGHEFYCFLDGYSLLNTKRRQHLHAPIGLLQLGGRHLGYAMLRAHFSDS